MGTKTFPLLVAHKKVRGRGPASQRSCKDGRSPQGDFRQSARPSPQRTGVAVAGTVGIGDKEASAMCGTREGKDPKDEHCQLFLGSSASRRAGS